MSFAGAEKLDDTGCWQAAAQCVARSFRAVCLREFPWKQARPTNTRCQHQASLYSDFFGYLAHIQAGLPLQAGQ
jgi:hypothetical protein